MSFPGNVGGMNWVCIRNGGGCWNTCCDWAANNGCCGPKLNTRPFPDRSVCELGLMGIQSSGLWRTFIVGAAKPD